MDTHRLVTGIAAGAPCITPAALRRHFHHTGLRPLVDRSWAAATQTLPTHPLTVGYRCRGGLIRDDYLVDALRDLPGFRIGHLARLIADRQLVHGAVAGYYWFPAFQFANADLPVVRAVAGTLDALNEAFDALEVAQWFSTPNEWLAGEVPADAVAFRPEAVVQAARTDRFIAMGWC